MKTEPVASWSGKGKEAIAWPTFWAVKKTENLLLVKKCASENSKFAAEKNLFWKTSETK